jgi:hypothetical protein
LQGDGGARTALSDGTGLFRFRDVAPGRYQLQATPSVTYGPTYSGTSQLAVEVASGLETQVTMYLPTLCGALATLPADASVTVQTSCSAGFSTVTVSPGDLRRPDGGAFSGSLRLRASYPPNNLLLPDGGPDRGAYMTLVGTSWGRTAADAGVFLSSRASATLALFDETTGDPLSVSSGRSVKIQLGLATRMDAGLVDGGSTIGAFRYRASSGEWFEETTASYVNTSGVRTYDLQTSTLGAWTAATAATSTSCVTGRVEWVDAGVPGADVWAYAIDRAQAARTNAESGGAFCLDLEADVPLYVLGRKVVPGLPAVFDPQGFLETRSATGGSCASARGSCADAGVLVLIEQPGACISGVARDTSSPPADGGSPPAYQSPFILASEPPRRTRRQAACSSGSQQMQYVDPGSSGAFCSAIVSGSTSILAIDPLGTCTGETRSLDAGAAGSCGGSGCNDLGDLEFFCGGS